MRTASRVFFWLGLFGATVTFGYAAASRFSFDNAGGTTTLFMFFVACMFLAKFMAPQGAIELDGLTLPGADAHEDEEIHLPGPSWWPAAYGVAAFVLMMGLALDRRVMLAGIALIVLTTIGWGMESVRDYRREIAHAKHEGYLPSTAAIELAQQVLAFRRLHGGADSVVQHVGRGRAQVVLVGNDGGFGLLHADDVAVAREAAALAATTGHTAWPSGLGARVRTDAETWRAMGGESLFGKEGTAHEAPRDGTTQVAARVFLSLSVFAFLADLGYLAASRFRFDNVQGVAVLSAFAIACFYLYLGLKNAKARPEDAAYAGDDYVTLEPELPEPPVDLETLHLPGPSWWPAFFSVALGLLVFGLVFNTGMLVAGVVGLVICCVGWGIESVREYRQSISGQHHGAPDALGNHPSPLAH
jgi:hypothetical protein